jgi:hypothetical protein
MGGRLKIRAGPLEFFDPPDPRGQTEASRSNKFHRLSLRIGTYKKPAGAHVMNRWRRSGNVFERSETVAQVAQAVILGQRDLRLLSCEGAYVAASATSLEYALTQKGGGGRLRPKADPSGKMRPRDDNVAKRWRDCGLEGRGHAGHDFGQRCHFGWTLCHSERSVATSFFPENRAFAISVATRSRRIPLMCWAWR